MITIKKVTIFCEIAFLPASKVSVAGGTSQAIIFHQNEEIQEFTVATVPQKELNQAQTKPHSPHSLSLTLNCHYLLFVDVPGVSYFYL